MIELIIVLMIQIYVEIIDLIMMLIIVNVVMIKPMKELIMLLYLEML